MISILLLHLYFVPHIKGVEGEVKQMGRLDDGSRCGARHPEASLFIQDADMIPAHEWRMAGGWQADGWETGTEGEGLHRRPSSLTKGMASGSVCVGWVTGLSDCKV
ncbi:hypothetical protein L204_102480 [Cryptococcus depauperatus]